MSKKYDFLSKKCWLCQWKKYYEIVRVKMSSFLKEVDPDLSGDGGFFE